MDGYSSIDGCSSKAKEKLATTDENIFVIKSKNQWKLDEEEEEEEKREPEEDGQPPTTFEEALVRSCENTSFQGISYVVAPTPFPLRRLCAFLTYSKNP